MSRILALFLLAGCAADEPGDALPSEQLPPVSLDLTVDLPGLVPGFEAPVEVLGALPGSEVALVVGPSTTHQGMCPPVLGGACIGLSHPVVLGYATADAGGHASFDLAVPDTLALGGVRCFQAVDLRGTDEAVLSLPTCSLVTECVPVNPTDASFIGLGTQSTPSVTVQGLQVTGSADLYILDDWGIGVVGGPNDSHLDADEWLELTFLDGPAADISYTNSGGVQNGTGGVGDHIVEVYDPDGALITSYTAESEGWKDVQVGPDVEVGSLRIQSLGDAIRLHEVAFDRCGPPALP